MGIYLGIDGGGSKTACVVADDTSVLGTATAAGSNVVRLGEEIARKNLHAAIQEACAVAGLKPANVDAAVIGVAGAGSVAETAAAIRQILADIGLHDVEVVGDNVIALEAAFAGLPGVVVIAGTGSIAFGRNQRGETERAGGHGFAVSDEGSGHWIGCRLVAAALRAYDAGNNELLEAVAASWRVVGRDALVQKANGSPRPDFAQLFPLTVEWATRGHSVAQKILNDAGRELSQLVEIVIQKLWQERKPVRVALGGGVFAHSPQVRKNFYLSLRELHPSAAVNFQIIEPVTGALWLARRAGVKVK
jgi:N-acetylglucosamine kinase-like BadF-type ATPase